MQPRLHASCNPLHQGKITITEQSTPGLPRALGITSLADNSFLQSHVQLVNSWRSVLRSAHRVPLGLWANREELDAFFAQPIDQVALVLMDTTFTHGVRVFDVLANHLRELALRRGPMLDVALFSCDELYLVVLFARCFIVVDFEGHAIQCVWLPPSLSWTHLCVADGSSHLFVRGVTRRDPPCFVVMAWPSV